MRTTVQPPPKAPLKWKRDGMNYVARRDGIGYYITRHDPNDGSGDDPVDLRYHATEARDDVQWWLYVGAEFEGLYYRLRVAKETAARWMKKTAP